MKSALLTLAAIAYGGLAVILFRRVELRPVTNRIVAHLLSFRLFIDEPQLIFRAQRDLLRENLRMLRLIAVPCLILAAAFGLVMYFFADGPIPPGKPFVVSQPDGSALPAGLVPETPMVRVPRLHQVAWRVHAAPGFSGTVPGPHTAAHVFGLHWLAWFVGLSALASFLLSVLYRPKSRLLQP